MKTFLLIGLKDLRILARDRVALIVALLAPFLLTIGLGFATGRFSPDAGGLSHIPVAVANLDDGELGAALAGVFTSDDLGSLVDPVAVGSAAEARRLVDADGAAAAVIVPEGFSRDVLSGADGGAKIEVYANPSRPVGAGAARAIVEDFLSRVEEGRVRGNVLASRLLADGLVDPEDAETAVKDYLLGPGGAASGAPTVALRTIGPGNAPSDFDPLASIAPGMALMFLMYTVSYGSRSLLEERDGGTLARLAAAPVRSVQVIGGKVLGVFLTGCLQVAILIAATSLLFGVAWGNAAGMAVLIPAAVFGAVGWGMLITVLASTPARAASLGTAVMLIFGVLGGTFVSLDGLPPFLRGIGRISPNSWGLDGFSALSLGGSLADIARPLAALAVMGAVLLGAAAAMYRRGGGAGR